MKRIDPATQALIATLIWLATVVSAVVVTLIVVDQAFGTPQLDWRATRVAGVGVAPVAGDTEWCELRRRTWPGLQPDPGFSARVYTLGCVPIQVKTKEMTTLLYQCSYPLPPANKDYIYEVLACSGGHCAGWPGDPVWIREPMVVCALSPGVGCPCRLFVSAPGCTE